jgi:hypothetical protein
VLVGALRDRHILERETEGVDEDDLVRVGSALKVSKLGSGALEPSFWHPAL